MEMLRLSLLITDFTKHCTKREFKLQLELVALLIAIVDK